MRHAYFALSAIFAVLAVLGAAAGDGWFHYLWLVFAMASIATLAHGQTVRR